MPKLQQHNPYSREYSCIKINIANGVGESSYNFYNMKSALLNWMCLHVASWFPGIIVG